MGCDIHMWAEVKCRSSNSFDKPWWETVGPIFENSFFQEDEPITYKNAEGFCWNLKFVEHPFQNRNYSLFAILADVRNGFKDDHFNPIDKPRGVPKDASVYYRAQVKNWGVDGHSHSFLTLNELKTYNWYQTIKFKGIVDVRGYKQFKQFGKPNLWYGYGVIDKQTKYISNQEMDKIIKDGNLKKNKYFTQIEWEISYADCVGDFLTKTIPNLEKLLKFKRVIDVRTVFFFDN